MHPDDPEVIFTLGLWRKEEPLCQAEEYYRKAIQIAPQFSEAFSNLGNVYFAKKQTDLAITSYQQAIDLSPDQGSLLLQPLPGLFPRDLPLRERSMRPFKEQGNSIRNWLNIIPRSISPPNMNRLVVDEVLVPQSSGKVSESIYWKGRNSLPFV